jgi:hypothetical protein
VRSPHDTARSRADGVRSSYVTEARITAQGDFNADDETDLAIASTQGTTVHLLLGEGQGRFLRVGEIVVGRLPSAIAAGDVNRDDHVDLVVARSADGAVVVFLGDGAGNFELASVVNLMRSACALTIGDFEGGPSPDVAVVHCGSVDNPRDALTILTGDGAGNLEPVLPSTQRVPDSVAVADVNEDGAADIVTLSPAGDVLDVFLSD